ncbi:MULTISPECIES: hypothetical protein [unclassified Streptomyces]|uniref:hypothetical protein n=1 Tax=unclassified Streptomyces TaxID=2593676 RepID=UPI0032D58CE7
MNSAPHLLNEDRPDFERVLDDALHTADTSDAPDTGQGGHGGTLNSEQLRTMALSAAELISACAAPEYQQYLKVREQIREALEETALVRRPDPDAADTRAFSYAAMGVADSAGSGAGLFAVVAVLTPILAGTAALIFLLIGYVLQAMTPEPAIAQPLRTAGWLFAGVTACGILVGMVGLLLTALRDSASAIHDDDAASLPPEVAAAREAWRRALRDRGVLPFLTEARTNALLAPHPAAEPPHTNGSRPSRMPRLGYSRPDFTSPGPEESPGPGHRFSSPDFSSPDYSSPDFTGPDEGSR